MARARLTDRKIKALAEPGKHADGAALFLVVTAKGIKRWEFQPSIQGKRRQYGLGVYPAVSLQGARQKAQAIRQAVKTGAAIPRARAPVDPKPVPLEPDHGPVTFRDAFEAFFTHKEKELSNAKHRQQWRSTMGTYVVTLIGGKPVAEIEASDILAILEPMWHSKRETAQRVLQRMSRVFERAILEGHRAKASPTTGVSNVLGKDRKPVQKSDGTLKDRHHGALPWKDVPAFVQQLRSRPRAWPSATLAFELLILTACRSGEVRGARWAEFDLDDALWTIPAHRMKARKEHRIPLAPRAIELLETAQKISPDSDLVFPAKRGGMLSDMTFTKAMRDMGHQEATPHGMRTAFKVWCASIDVADQVSEAALAHIDPNRVRAAYLRTDHLEQRRPLMARWSAFVTGDSK